MEAVLPQLLTNIPFVVGITSVFSLLYGFHRFCSSTLKNVYLLPNRQLRLENYGLFGRFTRSRTVDLKDVVFLDNGDWGLQIGLQGKKIPLHAAAKYDPD